MNSSTFLVLALLTQPSPGPVVLRLGEKEEWYQKAPEKEVALEGMVERTPTSGGINVPGRFNLYRLRYNAPDGKQEVRELHVPGKAYLLASHVGKKVRVKGKVVDYKTDDKTLPELWPATLEPLTGELAAVPGADGVFARGDWQPDEARVRGTKTYVIRTPEQLAKLMRVSGSSAGEAATAMQAERMRIPAIDWKKQMLVTVCAGLQGPTVEGLSITTVAVKDGKLLVSYKLLPARDAGASFGYPAQTVLVPLFEGEVRFEREMK